METETNCRKWTAYAGFDKHIIDKLAGSTLTEEEIAAMVAETRAEIKAKEEKERQENVNLESARKNLAKATVPYAEAVAKKYEINDLQLDEKYILDVLCQLETNIKNDIKIISGII